ncbi:MAG: hypothetical protein IPM15_04570 [Betaproteobacteria bacterium]|nr:hypothetical protein [Betaproteobacteria bacterium]MCC6246897.1 hypothetical protein [Rubrivivax sp.]MCL4696564.1 hypothetical protein [Burkholderiaceae bacterium]
MQAPPDSALTLRPFTAQDHAVAHALWQVTPGVGLSSADEPQAIRRFLERNPGLSFVGRALLARGLQALRDEGIAKCHLLVFGDNADGLAFWRSIGAAERHELPLFSIETDGDAAQGQAPISA